MYISHRAAWVRNFAVAAVNGSVTLVILLIAPLGLASVITTTFLVTVTSFFTATAADQIIRFLQPSRVETMRANLDSNLDQSEIRTRDVDDLDRR